MHTMSEKDLSSDELDTLRRSRTLTVVLTANEEVYTNDEAEVYVRDLNLFVTVQLLEETLAVLSLGKLCEDHGYSYEWVSGQKPRLTKEEKTIACKNDSFVPLVVPGLSTSSGSNSSSTSTSQDLSSTSPAKERSDGLAPRERCGSPPKPRTKIKRGMTGKIRTTVCEIFLSGWRRQRILVTQNCLQAHTFLRTQIRNVLRQWYQNQGSTVLKLTSQKNEVAKSAGEPKWQGLLAEDATGVALPRAEKFGDLITADHNYRYAVVEQDLATQWILSYLCETKSSHEMERSSSKFPGAVAQTKS